MCNAYTVKNPEECSAKAHTVMGVVDPNKAEKSTLECPFSQLHDLDPMPSYSKVAVSVTNLSCIINDVNPLGTSSLLYFN